MPAAESSRQLIEQGYAVFEGAYSDEDLAVFREGLTGLHAAFGSPACYSRAPIPVADAVQIAGTGLVVAKLLERRPDFTRRLLKAPLIEALQAVLGADMRIELTAAVIADSTRPTFPWHTHIGGQDDSHYKATGVWPRFERPRRVGTLLYLDELSDENGPLLLYPRAITDETAPPHDTALTAWEGERVLRVPRGTVVAMDECTWHTARPKITPGLRMIVACNYVSADAPPSPLIETALNRQTAADLLRSMRSA